MKYFQPLHVCLLFNCFVTTEYFSQSFGPLLISALRSEFASGSVPTPQFTHSGVTLMLWYLRIKLMGMLFQTMWHRHCDNIDRYGTCTTQSPCGGFALPFAFSSGAEFFLVSANGSLAEVSSTEFIFASFVLPLSRPKAFWIIFARSWKQTCNMMKTRLECRSQVFEFIQLLFLLRTLVYMTQTPLALY